jgi:streptomycin 6-kinase
MNFRESIPEELVAHTIAMCGDSGTEWLDRLRTTIEEIEENWSISVGDPFPSIEFNYVAAATDINGNAIVIKISPPFETSEIFSEAKFLRVANGRKVVRLLAQDRDRRAILIERALPGSNLTEIYAGNELKAVAPAIDVLRAITGKPPEDTSETIDLDDWFDGMHRHTETAFPAEYAVRALEIHSRLSRGVERCYLHGDFHPGNIVSDTREPFLAIDPKGMIGPIGYDIAVFLNNFHWWQEDRPDIQERLDFAVRAFSDAFDVSPADLRLWSFAQMVLSAWWTFDEMREIYQNDVAKADVWNV